MALFNFGKKEEENESCLSGKSSKDSRGREANSYD